jgi:type VI secretion system protein VasD
MLEFSMRVIASSMAVVASCVLLSACGAWQTVSTATSSAYQATFYKKVTALNVDLKARAMINPDDVGRPYSVVVRVYQLRDTKTFASASYDDLLTEDKTVLAEDLQDIRGMVVYPNGAASMSQPLKPNTQYIGIVAFYRDAKSSDSWRLIVPKKDLSADEPLLLELEGNSIIQPKDAPHDR